MGQARRPGHVSSGERFGAPHIEQDETRMTRCERGMHVPAIGLVRQQLLEMCERFLRVRRGDVGDGSFGAGQIGHLNPPSWVMPSLPDRPARRR